VISLLSAFRGTTPPRPTPATCPPPAPHTRGGTKCAWVSGSRPL